MEIGIGCLIMFILLFVFIECAMEVFFPVLCILFVIWVANELFNKKDK